MDLGRTKSGRSVALDPTACLRGRNKGEVGHELLRQWDSPVAVRVHHRVRRVPIRPSPEREGLHLLSPVRSPPDVEWDTAAEGSHTQRAKDSVTQPEQVAQYAVLCGLPIVSSLS